MLKQKSSLADIQERMDFLLVVSIIIKGEYLTAHKSEGHPILR